MKEDNTNKKVLIFILPLAFFIAIILGLYASKMLSSKGTMAVEGEGLDEVIGNDGDVSEGSGNSSSNGNGTTDGGELNDIIDNNGNADTCWCNYCHPRYGAVSQEDKSKTSASSCSGSCTAVAITGEYGWNSKYDEGDCPMTQPPAGSVCQFNNSSSSDCGIDNRDTRYGNTLAGCEAAVSAGYSDCVGSTNSWFCCKPEGSSSASSSSKPASSSSKPSSSSGPVKGTCYCNEIDSTTHRYTSTNVGSLTEETCYSADGMCHGKLTWNTSLNGQCAPGFEEDGSGNCLENTTHDFTCTVSMSGSDSVTANGQVVVTASVTVYQDGEVIGKNGVVHFGSGKWSTSGNGYSSGGTTTVIRELENSQTITANSSVGSTIKANYTATLTTGETCTGSKTITVVADSTVAPTTEAPTTVAPTTVAPTTVAPTTTTSSEYACYVVGNEYKWLSSKPSNGTIVKGVNKAADCHAVNPQTGTFGVVIAWIIGIAAIGYAIYYFKSLYGNKDY